MSLARMYFVGTVVVGSLALILFLFAAAVESWELVGLGLIAAVVASWMAVASFLFGMAAEYHRSAP